MKHKTMFFLVFVWVVVAMPGFCTLLHASDADDKIATAFKNTYVYKTYLKDDTIQIEAKYDGVVALTGVVADEAHKTLAGETMANLPSVTRVDNQLVTSFNAAAAAGNEDEWIAKRVNLALRLHHTAAGFSVLSVAVKDGVVTLEGMAASEVLIERAIVYAKDIEGVKDVRNKMAVSARLGPSEASEGSETLDDASVTALIVTALMTHRSTSSAITRVTTRNGEVTLTGIAKNTDQYAAIVRHVTGIQGVISVKNQMTIENVPGK